MSAEIFEIEILEDTESGTVRVWQGELARTLLKIAARPTGWSYRRLPEEHKWNIIDLHFRHPGSVAVNGDRVTLPPGHRLVSVKSVSPGLTP